MRIKTILLFAVLTATSLSIWGQCKLSPYTQQFVETVRKENISDVQRLRSAYYFKQDDNKEKIIISFTYIHTTAEISLVLMVMMLPRRI